MQAIEFRTDGMAVVRDVPRPEAGRDEAVIRVTSAGVCGSDMSALHGTHPFRHPPLISGHEVGGIVAEIGPGDSRGFSVGTPVVVDPQRPCRTCDLCRAGDYHLCTKKTMLGVPEWPGGLADFVKVPTFTLVAAPDGMRASRLSFAEPMAVAVHASRRAGSLDTVRRAVVLGGGTIGTLITAALSAQRPDVEITVVEPRLHLHEVLKLAGARQCVADAADLPSNSYDLVFLAAGVSALVPACVRVAATRGTIVQVAVFGAPEPVAIGELQIREITLTGTATYTKQDIASALDIIESNDPLVQRMVTYTDDWQDTASRITAMAADGPGEVMKLIMAPR